jgi:hypothetical protein
VDRDDEGIDLSLLHLRNVDLEIGQDASRRTKKMYESSNDSTSPYVYPDFIPYKDFYSAEIKPRRKLRWELIYVLYRCRSTPRNIREFYFVRKKRLLIILEGGQLLRRSMRRLLRKWGSNVKN